MSDDSRRLIETALGDLRAALAAPDPAHAHGTFILKHPPVIGTVPGLVYQLRDGRRLYLLPDAARYNREGLDPHIMRTAAPYSVLAVHGRWMRARHRGPMHALALMVNERDRPACAWSSRTGRHDGRIAESKPAEFYARQRKKQQSRKTRHARRYAQALAAGVDRRDLDTDVYTVRGPLVVEAELEIAPVCIKVNGVDYPGHLVATTPAAQCARDASELPPPSRYGEFRPHEDERIITWTGPVVLLPNRGRVIGVAPSFDLRTSASLHEPIVRTPARRAAYAEVAEPA